MKNSSVEINEREYCIKLNKDTFDLSFIRQLIKRIQDEQLFFGRNREQEEQDLRSKTDLSFDVSFDRLCDK